MLYIKDFDQKKVIISNSENNQDYLLTAIDDYEFDRDIIEDILDYGNRNEDKD